jgi:hypothetical protein
MLVSQSDIPRRHWRLSRDRRGARPSRGALSQGRVSAYVYGNIILFATQIPLSQDDATHGHAFQVLLGVAVSTYLAHVFADFIGLRVGTEERVTRAALRHELRDAMPIMSSAIVPCLLMAAAWARWLPASTAIIASDVYLLLRLALLGVIIKGPGERRTLVAGLVLAAVAAAIAALKATLGH